MNDFEKLFNTELSRTLWINEGSDQVALTERELMLKALVSDVLMSDPLRPEDAPAVHRQAAGC